MEHRSKHAAHILCIAACAALFLFLLLGAYELFFVPSDPVLSEEENRMLAPKPVFTLSGFFQGEFRDGVEQFLSDRFPGRAGVISLTQRLRQVGSLATYDDYARVAGDEDVAVMEYLENVEADDEAVIVTPRPTRAPEPTNTPAPVEEESTPAIVTTPEQASVETPAPTETPVPTATLRPTKEPLNLNDWPRTLSFSLIDGEKKMVAVSKNRNELAAKAKLFDAYASLLPEDGRFVMTIVPISTRAARLRSYAEPGGMTSEIEPFLHAVTGNNVSVISAADLLSEPLLQGEYVYFRTDRHWTPYGAHIVISRLLQEVGETLPPYDYFPKRQESPFLGTIYRDTHDRKLEKNPDTLDLLTPTHPVLVRRYSRPTVYEEITFIDENAKSQDRYACYLGGPHGQLTVIERTDTAPDAPLKTCFMITDSYGLCTTPFFMEAYDRVIVYDPRYYDRPVMGPLSDVIEAYGVKDIFLVAGEVDVFDRNWTYLGLINRHF